MKKIFFFSKNKNKINEIEKLFGDINIDILNCNKYDLVEPEEIGSTFKENAKIKSEFGFNFLKIPCFADDSGLCINALNNFPGIKSKRFIEESGGLEETFNNIANKMINLDDNAYFKTTISLTIKKGENIFFNGITKGKISKKPKGKNGFGYDAIFIPDGYRETFAEMSLKRKNQLSHRSKAIKQLKKYLLPLI